MEHEPNVYTPKPCIKFSSEDIISGARVNRTINIPTLHPQGASGALDTDTCDQACVNKYAKIGTNKKTFYIPEHCTNSSSIKNPSHNSTVTVRESEIPETPNSCFVLSPPHPSQALKKSVFRWLPDWEAVYKTKINSTNCEDAARSIHGNSVLILNRCCMLSRSMQDFQMDSSHIVLIVLKSRLTNKTSKENIHMAKNSAKHPPSMEKIDRTKLLDISSWLVEEVRSRVDTERLREREGDSVKLQVPPSVVQAVQAHNTILKDTELDDIKKGWMSWKLQSMTLATIKKRLSQLENNQPSGWTRVNSLDFEKYEDFLVEAKKACSLLKERKAEGKLVLPHCEIVAINIVPQAAEIRECLKRMEAAGMDENLIGDVKKQLRWREEEEREYHIL